MRKPPKLTPDEVALLVTMRTREGRHAISVVLALAGVEGRAYALGEPTHTAYLSGRRELGVELLEQLDRLCPEHVRLMQDETRERRTNDDTSRSDPGTGRATDAVRDASVNAEFGRDGRYGDPAVSDPGLDWDPLNAAD